MTFPLVVLALAVVLLAGSVAQAAVSCADGARAAARALSRGEPVSVAVAQAQSVLAHPAAVTAARTGPPPGLVRVEVAVSSPGAGVGGWSGVGVPVLVRCSAHAWVEPDG